MLPQQQVSVGYGPSIVMVPEDLAIFLSLLTRAAMLDDKKELVPVRFRVEPVELPREEKMQVITPAPAPYNPPHNPDDDIHF